MIILLLPRFIYPHSFIVIYRPSESLTRLFEVRHHLWIHF